MSPDPAEPAAPERARPVRFFNTLGRRTEPFEPAGSVAGRGGPSGEG